ncbi:MAG: GNAT family N-acetyltransferase [Streptosporangiaceae bacterium]
MLRGVDAAGFGPWVDAAVEVYAGAMKASREQARGRRPIMERHLGYPNFRAYLALAGEELAGFCYGFHGEPGQWWHDAVARGLTQKAGEGVALSWLDESIEVAELQVMPTRQGGGIGRALLTTLCGERAERTVVLSTFDTDSRARRLYRSLGYVDLLTAFRFPGSAEVFAVMGAPLPLPEADDATRDGRRSPSSPSIG